MHPIFRLSDYVLGLLVLLSSGCDITWTARPLLDPRLVARALHDSTVLPHEDFKPDSVPSFPPPMAIRPCCPFGMDLKVKLGKAPIPGYQDDNILGPKDLGAHGYNRGMLLGENNGLVYTCRGGFIDIAHVRDNADRTLYLAMQFARRLPDGFTLELPEEAAGRRVIVQPLPADLLGRYGRWRVATTLAQWVNYQLSIWHEISTWYGWQSIKGISERLSAFSPEDLYSNVVGQSLAAGIVQHQEADSRSIYDRAMDAWIAEALRRLGVVSRTDARRAMQAVDGLWWDSKQRMPAFKLVTRRNLAISSPVAGWLVSDAVAEGPVQEELQQMCENQAPPLALSIPERLGDHLLTDLATVEFSFSSWRPKDFPIPAQRGKTFTQAEFPELIRAIRARGEQELGPGFDQPRPTKDRDSPVAWLHALASRFL